MNGTSKLDQIDQAVRSYCVIVLVTALVAGWLVGVWRADPVIADSTFIAVVMFALQWWFKSRDDKAKAEQAASLQAVPPPPGTTVTSKVETVQTGGTLDAQKP